MTDLRRDTEHLSLGQVNAFADKELSVNEATAVEMHLAGCHACTLRVLNAKRLKDAAAAAANAVAVPVDAMARLTAHVLRQEPKPTARVYAFPALRWIALAACLLLAISLIGWRQMRRSDTLSAELLDQHLAVLSSGAAPEVISTDRHTVKPWFQGKLPFSFNLPEVLPPDTVLRGADLMYLDGHPAAMLLFTIHKHQVSVFLTQRVNGSPVPERSNRSSGFNVHYATTRELRIAGVSDVNAQELDSLIATLAQAQ